MTDTIHNFAHAATAIPLGLLEQHFSRAEARRQLDTAIDWGRYAELFGFEDDSSEMFLESPE